MKRMSRGAACPLLTKGHAAVQGRYFSGRNSSAATLMLRHFRQEGEVDRRAASPSLPRRWPAARILQKTGNRNIDGFVRFCSCRSGEVRCQFPQPLLWNGSPAYSPGTGLAPTRVVRILMPAMRLTWSGRKALLTLFPSYARSVNQMQTWLRLAMSKYGRE